MIAGLHRFLVPSLPKTPSTSVPYATLDCNGMAHRAGPMSCTKAAFARVIWAMREVVCSTKGVAQFIAVCSA